MIWQILLLYNLWKILIIIKKIYPFIDKADILKNLKGKLKQAKGMKFYNKPCLIINKSQEYNLNDNDEVNIIKEFIPEIVDYKDQDV